MKKLHMFLLIALFLVLSCAAPKMVILLQEPVLSKKYFQETYAKYDEEGNKTMTSLQYFINEDQNIENYNNIVASLSSIINDIKILTQSAIML